MSQDRVLEGLCKPRGNVFKILERSTLQALWDESGTGEGRHDPSPLGKANRAAPAKPPPEQQTTPLTWSGGAPAPAPGLRRCGHQWRDPPTKIAPPDTPEALSCTQQRPWTPRTHARCRGHPGPGRDIWVPPHLLTRLTLLGQDHPTRPRTSQPALNPALLSPRAAP